MSKIKKFVNANLSEKIQLVNNFVVHKAMIIVTFLKYKLRVGKLGHGVIIYKPLRFKEIKYLYMEESSRIYKGSRIECITKWGNEKYSPIIKIGEKTSVEQFLHLTCANKIVIGKNVVISANVLITDINHSYEKIHMNAISQALEVKEVSIGDYSFIGMGSKIMPGTKIGKNCIIGANSIVVGEIPDYCVAVGTPAKIIKKYNFEKKVWEKISKKAKVIDA